MWCPSCQQDVPGVASKIGIACARCRHSLSPGWPERPASFEPEQATDRSPLAARRANLWRRATEDLQCDLEQAEALLERIGRTGPALRLQRIDPPHSAGRRQPRTGAAALRETTVVGFCGWSLLSLGMMTFLFGAVLLGWAAGQSRPDLWRLGLPFTLGGQTALVVGLGLQLLNLWRSNSAARQNLVAVQAHLDQLRQSTELMTAARSPRFRTQSHAAELPDSQRFTA